MRTIIRPLILVFAGLFLAAGLTGAGAVAASAATPNACPEWANSVLYAHPVCYGNETALQKAPYFYWS